MGLSYKPNIDDLRESPSLFIALKLFESGINLIACEPNIESHQTLKVLQIDETNTTVTVTADDYDTTSGIGYTTATNYAS